MKTSLHEIEIIQKKANYHSDPTIIFNHLCELKPATLLLETAEINKRNALESIIIIDTAIRFTSENNSVTLTPMSINGTEILLTLKKTFLIR